MRTRTRFNGFRRRLSIFGSSAADPITLLPGFVFYADVAAMRSAGRLWQDTAKTIPATANGDPVKVFTTAAGDHVSPADASRGILTSEAGGKWSILNDGSDDGYDITVQVGPLWTAMAACVVWTSGSLMDADGNAETRVAQFLRGNTVTMETIAFDTTPSAFTANVGNSAGSGVREARRDATTVTACLAGSDGTPVATTGTPASAVRSLAIGLGRGSTVWSGRWSGILYCNAALTGADLSYARTRLNAIL